MQRRACVCTCLRTCVLGPCVPLPFEAQRSFLKLASSNLYLLGILGETFKYFVPSVAFCPYRYIYIYIQVRACVCGILLFFLRACARVNCMVVWAGDGLFVCGVSNQM